MSHTDPPTAAHIADTAGIATGLVWQRGKWEADGSPRAGDQTPNPESHCQEAQLPRTPGSCLSQAIAEPRQQAVGTALGWPLGTRLVQAEHPAGPGHVLSAPGSSSCPRLPLEPLGHRTGLLSQARTPPPPHKHLRRAPPGQSQNVVTWRAEGPTLTLPRMTVPRAPWSICIRLVPPPGWMSSEQVDPWLPAALQGEPIRTNGGGWGLHTAPPACGQDPVSSWHREAWHFAWGGLPLAFTT